MNMQPTIRESDIYYFLRYAKRELETDWAERAMRADGTIDLMITRPFQRLRAENYRDLIRETSR